jgi:integrase
MAVYDRWHVTPREGEQLQPCACGKGRNRLYPSAVHGQARRWQVQWEDPAAPARKRRKRNFALRDPARGEEPDPERHASAFDALTQGKIVTRTYTDPNAGKVTLRQFAEKLRQGRRIPNPQTAADLEGRLRLHVYEGEPGSGRTPMDAPSIGQHPMALLAAQPSLVAAWAAAIPLSPIRARHVMGDVSYCFRVAIDDNVVHRDPTQAQSVTWPQIGPSRARAWTAAQADAMRAELPARWRVLVDIGTGAGLRQGEMLALGTGDVDWLTRDDPRVRVVRQLRYAGGEFSFAPLKNRKPHSAPLSPELKLRLQRHLDEFPAVEVTLPWHDPADAGRGGRHGKPVTARLIVTTARGLPAGRHSLDNTWRRARRRAGITPEDGREREDGCHALRHTFVSTQLRAGTDVVRVAEFIGDSVKTVVDTYAHFMPGGDDGDARAAVDAFLRPAPCAPDVPSAGESAR